MLTFLLGLIAFPAIKWLLSKRTDYMSLPTLTDEVTTELINSVKKTVEFQPEYREIQSADRLSLLLKCSLFKTHRPTAVQASQIQRELLNYGDHTRVFRKLIKYPLLLQEHIEKTNELQQQRETDKLLEAHI